MKDRKPLTFSLHRGSLASIPIWFQASFYLALPGVAPPEDVERFVVSAADAQFPGGLPVRWREAERRRALHVAGQSPYPAGRPPRRERWPDSHADSYMLFPWASRTPIHIVQHSCTGAEITASYLNPPLFAAARLFCSMPTSRERCATLQLDATRYSKNRPRLSSRRGRP